MAIKAQFVSAAKVLVGVWMAGVIIAMFLLVPQYVGLGDAGRIIIMHVPTAWVTCIAFAVSTFYSVRYLLRKRVVDDAFALASAEAGFLFCVLATVTGAIFAHIVWGVFWNWDPRETSILILLLIYAAYFALRSAVEEPERRRRLSAAYNIFAGITMPFLLFVAPRVTDSTLHPNCAFIQGSKCDGVVLQLGGERIKQLGQDIVLELQGLQQHGDLVVAQVQARLPGGERIALEPTFELSTGKPADRPSFSEQNHFTLILEQADLQTQTVRLNVQAPGTGLLSNPRTLWTFLASTFGFTALFIWLYRLRAHMLIIEEQIAQREEHYGFAV